MLKQSWKHYIEAIESIEKDGKVLTCQNGRMFINPLVNEKNKCWEQIVKVSEMFGLVPTMRTKDTEEDPIEALVNDQG